MPQPFFPSLAPPQQSPEKMGAAPPCSPRLLTGRAVTHQCLAGQAAPVPPLGPSSSPRHTPGRHLHPLAPGGCGNPSSSHPRPSPGLPNTPSATPRGFHGSAGFSAVSSGEPRPCAAVAPGTAPAPHFAWHARVLNVDYQRVHVRGHGQKLG